MKTTTTKTSIASWVSANGPVTVKQIKEHFGIFPTMIHRHLNALVAENSIKKIGSSPRVFYVWATENNENESILWHKDREFLDTRYATYDSDGQILAWYEWFLARCKQRWLEPQSQYEKYKSIISYMQKKKDANWLMNWKKYLTEKLWEIYVDALYFIDPYQIGHFGRSKLWTTVFYGKQSQNRSLIKQALHIIKYPILSYIQQNKIDCICFAPPSIKRWVQLMTELKKWLNIDLPEIKLVKMFPSGVVIPQKSLKSMEQRIKNAENTIFISPWQVHQKYKNVLLLDDFMWSGATVNFCAKKIKNAWGAKKFHVICLLGNVDTEYDVINEI